MKKQYIAPNTKAIEMITYAKSIGIDFIICDHHVPDEILPPAVAILNPKQPDDSYPFKQLCGCGVGFKFMQAFAKNNGIPFSHLIPLLDFCAVSRDNLDSGCSGEISRHSYWCIYSY